jgi:hypothetical protein
MASHERRSGSLAVTAVSSLFLSSRILTNIPNMNSAKAASQFFLILLKGFLKTP